MSVTIRSEPLFARSCATYVDRPWYMCVVIAEQPVSLRQQETCHEAQVFLFMFAQSENVISLPISQD